MQPSHLRTIQLNRRQIRLSFAVDFTPHFEDLSFEKRRLMVDSLEQRGKKADVKYQVLAMTFDGNQIHGTINVDVPGTFHGTQVLPASRQLIWNAIEQHWTKEQRGMIVGLRWVH